MAVDVELNAELKERLLSRTLQMLDAIVDEVMTKTVISCDYNDLSAKAARILIEEGILGILVFKDGHPHSMITSFDLLRLSYEEVFDPNRDFLRTTVGYIVADKPLVSVRSGTKLRELINIMIEANVRSVPVIDEGLVRGIVSLTDLIRWYRDTHDEVRTGKL